MQKKNLKKQKEKTMWEPPTVRLKWLFEKSTQKKKQGKKQKTNQQQGTGKKLKNKLETRMKEKNKNEQKIETEKKAKKKKQLISLFLSCVFFLFPVVAADTAQHCCLTHPFTFLLCALATDHDHEDASTVVSSLRT